MSGQARKITPWTQSAVLYYSFAILGSITLGSAALWILWRKLSLSNLTLSIITIVFVGLILMARWLFISVLQHRDDQALKAVLLSLPNRAWITNQKGAVLLTNGPSSDEFLDILNSYSADTATTIRQLLLEAKSLGRGKLQILEDDYDTELNTVKISKSRYLWSASKHKEARNKNNTAQLHHKTIDASHNFKIDLEELPLAAIIMDPSGHFHKINQAARRLLSEVYREDLHFHEVFDGLGRPVSDWLQSVLNGKQSDSSEVLHLISDKNERFIHIHLMKIILPQGNYALATLTDGSSFRRIEMQFNQSQKMQVIGQLAGGIAHDFNNILTAISGYCDLLISSKNENDPDHYDLNQIRQNTNRASSLVSQLLAFSRKQPLSSEVVDVYDILTEVSHLLNRLLGDKFQMTYNLLSKDAVIFSDRRRIEQVIINLVLNARDAMPEGGDIVVDVDYYIAADGEKKDNFEIKSGKYVQIRVIDQGNGIKAENLSRVFDPFFTTKPVGQGTGLGLATVYGIVKQSGGYVFVESVEYSGTTFTVLIPAYGSNKTTHRPVKSAFDTNSAGQSRGVLIIDDEQSIRELLSRSFSRMGYSVYPFDNVEAASRFLSKNSHKIGTMVTDIVMPDANGIDWARHARTITPNMRIIFISGYADEIIVEETQRMANSFLINKPFKVAEILALLPPAKSRESVNAN